MREGTVKEVADMMQVEAEEHGSTSVMAKECFSDVFLFNEKTVYYFINYLIHSASQ